MLSLFIFTDKINLNKLHQINSVKHKSSTTMNDWNHIKWLEEFKDASKNKSGFRELRIDVFQNTVELIKNGFYYSDDLKIEIENQDTYKNGMIFYDKPPVFKNSPENKKTNISVINADCLEVARTVSLVGYNPAVLNMANRHNPGGGVHGGAGAQEENIFRRSNIHLSLFQFVDYCSEYNIKRNKKFGYPMHRETGGIYSPNITIFRASEKAGYCLLKNPYKLSFISVAAISNPKLVIKNDEYQLADNLTEPAREKIRTILRIGLNNNHDSLILSAFGCGAFQNPPKHIARLFKEVLNENELKNQYGIIIFAILDDHNTHHIHNPEGNFLPFLKEFEDNY